MLDALEKIIAPRSILDAAPCGPRFPLTANRAMRQFHATKAKDKKSRAGIKRLIQPKNAAFFKDYIPRKGETIHAVVRGDFVFCDIIPIFLESPAKKVAIATLGLSLNNAKLLQGLLETGKIEELSVIVSHYFSRVDKDSTFAEVSSILKGAIHVARCHAKIILIDAQPNAYVLAGSANLRSSDNIEQFSAWNDKELLDWHFSWMEELKNEK